MSHVCGHASAAGAASSRIANAAVRLPTPYMASAAAPKAMAAMIRRQSSGRNANTAATMHQRSQSGTHQIGAIDGADAPRPSGKDKGDGARRGEERHGKQQIDRRQMDLLAPIPNDLERVERQVPRQRIAPDRRDAEQGGQRGEASVEPRQQAMLDEYQERSAGTVAEQRQADDHVGEVVPQGDREQARQKDLVGDGRQREERDGHKQRHCY